MNIIRTLATITFMFICLFSSGCAYMINGGYQTIHIQAQPNDADIRSEGAFIGSGDVSFSVDRSHSQNILVSKENYEDGNVYLKSKPMASWVFLDVATCVIPVALCIPVLVDAVSGAWNHFDNKTYQVKLKEKNNSAQ